MQTDKLHESFDFSLKSANSFQLDKKTKIRGCVKDKSVCRRQKLNAKTPSLHSSLHNDMDRVLSGNGHRSSSKCFWKTVNPCGDLRVRVITGERETQVALLTSLDTAANTVCVCVCVMKRQRIGHTQST